MTLQDQRDVIQAAIDGKRLQWKDETQLNSPWRDAAYPCHTFGRFDFTRMSWRVKPEPREWWVAGVFQMGHPSWIAYETQEMALQATRCYPGTFITHVREVLD